MSLQYIHTVCIKQGKYIGYVQKMNGQICAYEIMSQGNCFMCWTTYDRFSIIFRANFIRVYVTNIIFVSCGRQKESFVLRFI